MGGGTFDYSASAARAAVRKSTGTDAFAHDRAARMGVAPKLHPTLDTRTKNIREARDNDDNPLSVPIAIVHDVTGSMGEIPRYVLDDLSKLMKLVLEGGVVKYPQICPTAVGDATSDSVPIQVGEFEADDELVEKHLTNIYKEGGGGGQHMESYELMLWFFANQVLTDAYEKRGQKGFLFLIGDEAPYSMVYADYVKQWFNVDLQEDVTLETVARQLQEKWEVFLLRPGGTCHFSNATVINAWKKILPVERVIQVPEWQQIVPQIAGTISVMAGMDLDDTVAMMRASGFDSAVVDAAAGALVPLANTTVPVVAGAGALVNAGSTPPRAERL